MRDVKWGKLVGREIKYFADKSAASEDIDFRDSSLFWNPFTLTGTIKNIFAQKVLYEIIQLIAPKE